jgi:hypothetical protein
MDFRLPPTGYGREADIERLLEMGEKLAAIRHYRELPGTGLNAAEQAFSSFHDRPGV